MIGKRGGRGGRCHHSKNKKGWEPNPEIGTHQPHVMIEGAPVALKENSVPTDFSKAPPYYFTINNQSGVPGSLNNINELLSTVILQNTVILDMLMGSTNSDEGAESIFLDASNAEKYKEARGKRQPKRRR